MLCSFDQHIRSWRCVVIHIDVVMLWATNILAPDYDLLFLHSFVYLLIRPAFAPVCCHFPRVYHFYHSSTAFLRCFMYFVRLPLRSSTNLPFFKLNTLTSFAFRPLLVLFRWTNAMTGTFQYLLPFRAISISFLLNLLRLCAQLLCMPFLPL